MLVRTSLFCAASQAIAATVETARFCVSVVVFKYMFSLGFQKRDFLM